MLDWTWQRLAHYMRGARIQVELEGVTEEGLERALRQEALRRLEEIEGIAFCEEGSEEEKLQEIREILSRE